MNTSTSKWGLSRTTSCMGESPEGVLGEGGVGRGLTMRSLFRASAQFRTLTSESPYSCGE